MFRLAASRLKLTSTSRFRYGTRSLTQTTFVLPDPAESRKASLAKIVATIGPTSEQRQPLEDVTAAGMTIMRLNFSHATKEEVELRTTNLALAQKALQPPGVAAQDDIKAILLDTKGPEIRTGTLANDDSGHATIPLTKGDTITLVTTEQPSTNEFLYIDYQGLDRCLEPGRKVLLDDGAIILTVQSVSPGQVVCEVQNTGDLRSRAGVNLPLADTSDLPALSEKDKKDIHYGMSVGIDYVAASFVQTADGVRQIRAHMEACAKELNCPMPLIISKIETAGALGQFDSILAESDGIMVARGDLGVEIPLTQVANAQKEMVAACNAAGKPVIVATQMLESMGKNPRPTRAEVSDVTNAIYDGADCVMLSGETAKGQYPTEAVETMNQIIRASEEYAATGPFEFLRMPKFTGPQCIDSAIAKAAVAAADERDCTAILVLSQRGALPPLVSAFRPSVPIVSFCSTAHVARRLQIYRGIHPILNSASDKTPEQAIEEAKSMGYIQAGDEVVVVYMEGDAANMKIATVH